MADKILTARAGGSGYVRLDKTIINVYSKEILLESLPLFILDQFSIQKTELSALPGLGINFLQYTDIDGGGRLTEQEEIDTSEYSESLTLISVYEYGNAVKVSELLMESSFDNVMGTVTLLMARNYSKVVDDEIKDVILNSLNRAYGPDMSTGLATGSRAAINQNCIFGGAVVKDVVEHLDTIDAPRFNNDYFVGVVSPHQLRTLSDDKYWHAAQEYAGTTALFTGERGMIEGVRFVQTNQMKYWSSAVAGTTPVPGQWDGRVYYGAIFGSNAWAHAQARSVELRDGGLMDYGRKRGLAWYSIEGFDFIYDDAVVVVETA